MNLFISFNSSFSFRHNTSNKLTSKRICKIFISFKSISKFNKTCHFFIIISYILNRFNKRIKIISTTLRNNSSNRFFTINKIYCTKRITSIIRIFTINFSSRCKFRNSKHNKFNTIINTIHKITTHTTIIIPSSSSSVNIIFWIRTIY